MTPMAWRCSSRRRGTPRVGETSLRARPAPPPFTLDGPTFGLVGKHGHHVPVRICQRGGVSRLEVWIDCALLAVAVGGRGAAPLSFQIETVRAMQTREGLTCLLYDNAFRPVAALSAEVPYIVELGSSIDGVLRGGRVSRLLNGRRFERTPTLLN